MAITWSKTPFMEKLNLNGTEAYFADKEAREHIELLEKATVFLGFTATQLEDGSTTNPILVYKSGSTGETNSVTAKSGNIVIRKVEGGQDREFIYNGSSWGEFGSSANLKAFAFVDTGYADYTPGGDIVFCNATMDLCVGSLCVSGSATGNYTPTGTVTDGQVVAAGSVDVSSVKATGTVSLTNVTPTGTVTAPAVTLGCTTDTVTTHTFDFCSTSHVLSITDNCAQTLINCICVSCVSDPTFNGTALTGEAGFCGTGMEGTATFTGSCTTVTGMGFYGYTASLCLEVGGCTAATQLTGTSFGNVSGVTFSGCAATLCVLPCA